MRMQAKAKGAWLSKFLSRMAAEVDQALFRYQVKTGLILCAVEPGDGEEGEQAESAETDTETAENAEGETNSADDDQNGAETKTATDDAATDEHDEVVITIGDEKPDSDDDENDSATIRRVRQANREAHQRIRDLEQKLSATTQQQHAAEVGAKPTLESCDFDADKFEAELDAWKERKRQADAKQEEKKQAEEAQRRDWQTKLDNYAKRKTELKVKDFEDAEEAFKAATTVMQQGVVLQGSEDPALLVAALGRAPKKLAELAAIKDPVKFAFAVAKLESQLKVTTRKTPPLPEKSVAGSASTSGTAESQLERLRADAAKTGDMTKLLAFKKQQRQKQA